MSAQPTLVRYWKDGYTSEPVTAFVDWEQDGAWAEFTVTSDHPLSRVIEHLPRSPCLLTVYSTDELEWQIHQAQSTIWFHGVKFTCVQRVKRLRDSLISDDSLIEMWLGAENDWIAGLL